MFLININYLPDRINSLCKMFTNDTSLFSNIYDIHKSASKFNGDLGKNKLLGFSVENAF